MADRMSILLIGGYIGALALGAYELQRVPSVPGSIPGKAVEPLPPLEVPPDVIKNIAVFDAIIERPLFSRERLPEVATQSPGPPKRLAQSDEIEGMRLTAVLKGPDSLTVLLEERSGQTRVLHQGDQLGKWRIEEIMDDRIIMVSEERTETLLVHQFDPVIMKRTTRRRPTPAGRQVTRRPAQAITPRPPAVDRKTGRIPAKP